jgi:type II secretion system protein D
MNVSTFPASRLLRKAAAIACLFTGGTSLVVCAQQPSSPQPLPSALASRSQVYAVPAADIALVAGRLQERFAARPDVKIAGDARSQQLVVIGPADAQQEIAAWLANPNAPPLPSQPAGPPPAAKAPEQAIPLVTQSFRLRNVSWKDFETRLASTWGKRLEASHDPVGDMATFRFPPTSAGSSSIVVDRRTSLVTIAAPPTAAAPWQRLMTILDSRPQSPDEKTSIVPLVKADPTTIQRAISLVQHLEPVTDQSQHRTAAVPSRRKQHIGQFVSMMFQPEGGGQEAAPGDTVVVGEAPPASVAEAIARIGNVQIEILDDVVIVRGRAQDVERVMQIIEQIEAQSLQFKPEVEIYHLKHVNGEALSTMIAQVYATVFARQGTVTIVPLVKPNALMLIGRKENIPAVIELIQKLDQPTPNDAEFKVYPLKYISAIDAERVVRQFFVDRPGTTTNLRPGLGTRVLAIAEYRANVLMVQASPRDMLEVDHLIQSLDVGDSQVKNELRIFKLRNAVATDLAPVLLEAITGSATTQAATQAGAAAAGGGAGAAANSPARALPPAVNLQFLQIGAGGQQLIQSGILATVRISADTRNNALIVVAPATAMELMQAIIDQLDQLPSAAAQVKVFTLKNGDATSLAEMLNTLFGITQAGAAGAVQTATGGGESTLVPLRFSVDQRTNTIIATGNPGDLDVVYAILTRLDQGDVRQRITEVYRLNNAPAADVATALSGAAGLLTLQQQLIQAAPNLVTPIEQIERQVIVVSEPVTNSLIISATPQYMQEVKRVIRELDRRPPMVVIQVVIAEVSLNDIEQFGVEWGLQDSLMFDRSILTNRYNFESIGTAVQPNDNTAASLATRENVATQALANFALGRTDPALGFGGLVLNASNESISVLLRALEQSSRAQVISRPQVQTMDNVAAFVQVGSLVPRITGASTTQLGVVQPTVADQPVGIILQVTPRTSPDGTIVMNVNAEKSAVGPDATAITIAVDSNGNPITSPQILITTAQTTVSAKSGQTVILGGLITRDQQESTNRIPNLADIPVLGRLFRFDSASTARTELLIIMTPYIIESEEQTDWLNMRETERMSWCLGDIVNIHGPVPMAGSPQFNGTTPLIFPDLQPGAPAQPVQPTTPTPGGYGPAAASPTPATPLTNAPTWQPSAAPPPASVIVPAAPGMLPPAARPIEPTPLVPQTIQPAAPPAGTESASLPWRLPPPISPAPSPGPPPQQPYFGPPVVPAGFQQTFSR